jgi:hypothetical protein
MVKLSTNKINILSTRRKAGIVEPFATTTLFVYRFNNHHFIRVINFPHHFLQIIEQNPLKHQFILVNRKACNLVSGSDG